MGNCIRKQSSTVWGGEDWGSFGSNNHKTRNRSRGVSPAKNMQPENSGKDVLSSSLAEEGTEVKIKISKKQLEKLLEKADIEGLSVQQVLADLMNGGDRFEDDQRSPVLQSIPE